MALTAELRARVNVPAVQRGHAYLFLQPARLGKFLVPQQDPTSTVACI